MPFVAEVAIAAIMAKADPRVTVALDKLECVWKIFDWKAFKVAHLNYV
jgi:hypothetical protein